MKGKKPTGKQVRQIRKMLRNGIPPSSIQFDAVFIDRIFGKMSDEERFKIARKVREAEVEVNVSEEDSNAMLNSVIVRANSILERSAQVKTVSSLMPADLASASVRRLTRHSRNERRNEPI